MRDLAVVQIMHQVVIVFLSVSQSQENFIFCAEMVDREPMLGYTRERIKLHLYQINQIQAFK